MTFSLSSLPTLIAILLLSVLTAPMLAQQPAQQPANKSTARLPRENLMLFRDANGKATQVRSTADWQLRRREVMDGVRAVMGSDPHNGERCELDMKVVEEVDCGTYVRRLITYASEPKSRVPAYLCVPKSQLEPNSPRAPAVLCLHPTDNTVGHKVVVGLGGRANRQYASELAERGYVTLAPSYPLLANYQPDVIKLGWKSGTMKAVWDNMRGIDLLQSFDFVNGEKIGAIGHSLGGHNSVYTAVHDDRVKVVVSSCGLDSFLDYYDGAERVWLPEKGWTQTRYMPKLREYRGRLEQIPFDFHELLGSLAPRPVLIIAPLHDSNFRFKSVDRVAKSAAAIYSLYRRENNTSDKTPRLKVLHPDCPHDFPLEMRQAAYAWIDKELKE